MKIIIDKGTGVPIYQQLIKQLFDFIENGKLQKGDKLPTERDLSIETGISRGTIHKAYDELTRRGVLESVQGKGTFVYSGPADDIKKSYALNSIEQNIAVLGKMGFTYGEIKSMYDVLIMEKTHTEAQTKIASIDCNPEALEIFQRQVSEISSTWFFPFLLNDVMEFSNPEEVFENFDMIISTTTHYDILKDKLGNAGGKLVKTAVSADRETIVELAGIPDNSQVGILSKSSRFADIICNNLLSLNKNLQTDRFIISPQVSEQAFAKFLGSTHYVISPPFYTLNLSNRLNQHFLNYHSSGRKIIIFNYTIERGSLIYILDTA